LRWPFSICGGGLLRCGGLGLCGDGVPSLFGGEEVGRMARELATKRNGSSNTNMFLGDIFNYGLTNLDSGEETRA